MGETQILLLNAGANRHLASSLELIFRETEAYQFQVTQRSLRDSDSTDDLSAMTQALSGTKPDLALLCLPDEPRETRVTVDALVPFLRKKLEDIPLMVVLESAGPQRIFELLQLGIDDVIVSPLRANDVAPRLLRLHRHIATQESPLRQFKEGLGLKQFVGESEVLFREIRKIPKVAQCDASVLISGETGTGKEMFARAVHYLSPRSRQPFTPVNCGAIPADLVENELFGHEAGAYTGAQTAAPGLIQDTDGGTLFLDEIDSLPLQSQVKLLRFLQDKEYRPLGSRHVCKADIRVIAASNANFEEVIRSGRFRSDLYYRLNVITLLLPPLREREGDILPLSRHILAKYCREYSLPVKSLSDAAARKLLHYRWPGNIRELENILAGAVILSDQPMIRSEDIRLPSPPPPCEISFKALKARAIAEFETRYIRELLTANDGNITKAARAARKNRRAFWQLMQKHRIQQPVPSEPANRPAPDKQRL
jgi:two-component system, NtrC family, response regulator GlrR